MPPLGVENLSPGTADTVGVNTTMISSAKACPAVQEIPGRCNAETALAAACRSGRRSFWFAVVLLADQLPEILEAGDYETADRALLAFCQQLVRVLPPQARLYRWSGTSLVILLENHGSAGRLEWDLNRLPGIGARRVFPLASSVIPEEIYRDMDLFVAQNL